MFSIRLLVSVLELVLMIVMAGVLISVIYRVFVKANPDFDMEEEIKNGNPAVGTLMASIMISVALLLGKGMNASVGAFRLALSTPAGLTVPPWQSGLLVVGHLILSLGIAVCTISFTLRFFGRMTRSSNPEMCLGKHLKSGNLAVGIILAAVVFIATLYVGEGLSSLTKALVPQPRIGKIQMMH